MWLLCSIGCFSVVAHCGHPDALVIGARAISDLEALRDRHLPDIEIERTQDRALPFRVVVARDEWAHAVERMARAIDYVSFEPQCCVSAW